jgi:hypothetical protein
MLTRHVALVAEGAPSVEFDRVVAVAAALQKQVTRDFGPIWGLRATVDPFTRLDQVPVGYWIVNLQDEVPGTLEGYHQDPDGHPSAVVKADGEWSITASHECLEMLADPSGNLTVPGQSPKKGQGRVEFLLEVCDPVQASDCAYQVNGVRVSDFFTPSYLDPERVPGTRYDFRGLLKAPRSLHKGGSLAWRHPGSGAWWQANREGRQLQISKVVVPPHPKKRSRPLREAVNEHTSDYRAISGSKAHAARLARGPAARAAAAASDARAHAFRRHLEELRQEPKPRRK